MRILLALLLLVVLFYVMLLHWNSEKSKYVIPETKARNNTKVIDSLTHELKTKIDTLSAYKPVIAEAIAKLRFYDSVFEKKNEDTTWIKRMRSDLYEARAEIRRLCEPRYYRVSFNSQK